MDRILISKNLTLSSFEVIETEVHTYILEEAYWLSQEKNIRNLRYIVQSTTFKIEIKYDRVFRTWNLATSVVCNDKP